MKSWFEPLSVDELNHDPEFKWLTWFLPHAVVMTSEKGSMEIRLIKHLVTHINCFVRQNISEYYPYVLTLDRNSSRNGYEWLDYCQKVECEVIQLPSNTSNFLQPCNRKVNKRLKNAVRSFRDKLGSTILEFEFCANQIDTSCRRIFINLCFEYN